MQLPNIPKKLLLVFQINPRTSMIELNPTLFMLWAKIWIIWMYPDCYIGSGGPQNWPGFFLFSLGSCEKYGL